MKTEKVDYADVIALGFEEQLENDTVFFNQNGYPYKIITKNLAKRVYIDWDQETRFLRMIRVSRDGCITAELKLGLETAKALINFYKK